MSFKAGSIAFKQMSIGGQIGPNVNSDEWPATVGLDAMVVTLIAIVDTSMVALAAISIVWLNFVNHFLFYDWWFIPIVI